MKSGLIAALILLLSAGTSCRRFVDNAEGNALADRPAHRVSGKVTAKAGPWRKAWVEVAADALARVTAVRGKAEPEVEARLVLWVGSGTGDMNADDYLVRAASALSSQAVRTALTTRASECADRAPEPWIDDPDAFTTAMSRRMILPGCVARGALERSPGADSADRPKPSR